MSTTKKPKRGPLARTVVHQEGTLKLYRYSARAPRAERPPVVLVYSFINKPNVLDLLPDRSVIQSLLEGGLDVFLVDWGNPGAEESSLDLGGHTDRLERAVRAALQEGRADGTASERAQVLGYCLGGTMALVLAAVSPALVERTGLLATPVLFEKGGTLALWVRAGAFDPAKMRLSPDGNVPGEALRETFRWLDPIGQIRKFVTVAERYEDPDFMENFLAQERWANSCVDFPGLLFEQLLVGCYREDKLARNELACGTRKVELAKIAGPILHVIAEGDKIVPEESSTALETLAPRVRTLRVPGGHIGMTVGRRAPGTTHAALVRFFRGEDS